MSKGEYYVESVILTITLIFGLLSILDLAGFSVHPMLITYSFIWWAVFGLLQVIHAITMAIVYRNNNGLSKKLRNYFFGVGLDFFLLLLCYKNFPDPMLGILSVFLIPGILAVYLWYITYIFQEKNLLQPQREEKTNLTP